jgi:hypothetical protein
MGLSGAERIQRVFGPVVAPTINALEAG